MGWPRRLRPDRPEEIQRDIELSKYRTSLLSGMGVVKRSASASEEPRVTRSELPSYAELYGPSKKGKPWRQQLVEVWEEASTEEEQAAVIKHFVNVQMHGGTDRELAMRRVVRIIERLESGDLELD